MCRKTMILLPGGPIGALPFAGFAETMDQGDLERFLSASLTVQQARDAARQAHAGTLAAVAFGDGDGRAAYEALVIAALLPMALALFIARKNERRINRMGRVLDEVGQGSLAGWIGDGGNDDLAALANRLTWIFDMPRSSDVHGTVP